MIQTWTLQHFKSIYERTELPLAPLTVFAGANSSGKSTFIQSILLTAQTIQSPVASRSVILNGHIVKLGTFDDVVSNARELDPILIGFSIWPTEEPSPDLSLLGIWPLYRLHGSVKVIDCSYRFGVGESSPRKVELQLQPRLEESELRVVVQTDDRSIEESIHIRRSELTPEQRLTTYHVSKDSVHTPETMSLGYEVIRPVNLKQGRRFYYGVPGSGRPVGASLEHFVPSRLTIVYDAIEEESRRLFDLLLAPTERAHRDIDIEPEVWRTVNAQVRGIVLNVINGVLGEDGALDRGRPRRLAEALDRLEAEFSLEHLRYFFAVLPQSQRRALIERLAERQEDIKDAARGGRASVQALAQVPLSELLAAGTQYIEHFFRRRLKYLGPLRDEPKPVYPLAGATDPRDIGYKGEHTAAVLDIHRETMIRYVPSSAFRTGAGTFEPRYAPLANAVLDWLGYMGVASSVITSDRGKLGHELRVATTQGQQLHDLTHVGVGVSQVLPILVLSLLAEPGATLVFEQPELHLHPRVQTRLADFLVSLTMLRKQCIVETHSEYLINRLRYRAVLSDADSVSSQVLLYFVENLRGHTRFRPIRVSEFGTLEEWPSGFFDESEQTTAEIIKEAMGKRGRRRGQQEQ